MLLVDAAPEEWSNSFLVGTLIGLLLCMPRLTDRIDLGDVSARVEAARAVVAVIATAIMASASAITPVIDIPRRRRLTTDFTM
jgi:hypothetical protein